MKPRFHIRPGSLPNHVEVHALTPMMYVVYPVDGARRTPVADQRGTIVFPSRAAARDALAVAGVEEITFIHQSTYNEMVGLEAGGANATEFRETLRCRHG